jgi:flavin reductase (DIM6/NTAB) family NADH-FMN oxidoreductase RutF
MTGSPVLDNCLAWLDCRVLDEYTVGERCYYWAEVVASRGPASTDSGRPCPLRTHQLFAQASAEQLGLLRDGMLADIEAQRPLIQQWRRAKE